METRTVSAVKAAELLVTLNAIKAGALKANAAYYKLEAKGDVLLVDPVNGDPFVFVAPSTVQVFVSKSGSGTDHLRQRMLADRCFQQLSSTQLGMQQVVVLEDGQVGFAAFRLAELARVTGCESVVEFEQACQSTPAILASAAKVADAVERRRLIAKGETPEQVREALTLEMQRRGGVVVLPVAPERPRPAATSRSKGMGL